MRSSTASSRRLPVGSSTSARGMKGHRSSCAWPTPAPDSAGAPRSRGRVSASPISASGCTCSTGVRRRSSSAKTRPADSSRASCCRAPRRSDRCPHATQAKESSDETCSVTAATAMIVEDEPLMRERLRDKLAELWPSCTIVAEAADGDEALALFDIHAPQVAFLDVRMPGRSGLDVAASIGADCHVVFITAYDQYAISAFAAGAVDYLLKPVESDRLAQTIERVQKKLASPPADLTALLAQLQANSATRAPARLKWIKAAVGKQIKLIAVADVVLFQSDTKYTRVVLPQSEALIRTPLKELLAELDPDQFWQVHRSTVVNLDAVAGVLREDAERQFVLLKNRPDKITISRQFIHLFKQM